MIQTWLVDGVGKTNETRQSPLAGCMTEHKIRCSTKVASKKRVIEENWIVFFIFLLINQIGQCARSAFVNMLKVVPQYCETSKMSITSAGEIFTCFSFCESATNVTFPV